MNDVTCLKCPKKYMTLIGGLICYISLGSSSITSTTSPYYMSYLQVRENSDLARYSNTIYLSNLLRLTQALSAITFGSLMTKYKFTLKQMSFCGGLVISSGFILSYYTIKNSFPLFLFSFSFMFGAGMGMCFIVPVSLVTKWFPESKGKVTAFIFIGQGIGGVIFPAFSTYYVNPNNLAPDRPYSKDFPHENDNDLLDKVPDLFLIVGIATACLNILGLLMMHERDSDPEKKRLINNNEDNDVEQENQTEEANDMDLSRPKLTLKQALKIPDLYLLAFVFCFASTSISIFTVNYKNYGQTFIKDDQFLTLIYTISVLVNIPTRLIWGWIIDRLSFKLTYLIILSAYMVFTFTVCLNEYYGNQYTYMGYFILIDFCKNGHVIVTPYINIKRFGQENIVLINGLIKFFGIPGSIISALIAPPLLENFGYYITFSVTNIFPAISWIAVACFKAQNNAGGSL